MYVTRKDPTLLLWRKLRTARKRVASNLVVTLWLEVPKKACTKKQCYICKKHGGPHTTHNNRGCRWFEKDETEKNGFCTAKKGGKKPNSTKQSFAQLSKKMGELEKAIKKQTPRRRNMAVAIMIPTMNRELGWVAWEK